LPRDPLPPASRDVVPQRKMGDNGKFAVPGQDGGSFDRPMRGHAVVGAR
jgi:hypothetical protein